MFFVEQLLDCRASRSHTTGTRQRPRSSCSGGSVTACWLFRMHDSSYMCIRQKSYAIDIIGIIDKCDRSHRHNVRSKFELDVYFEAHVSSKNKLRVRAKIQNVSSKFELIVIIYVCYLYFF